MAVISPLGDAHDGFLKPGERLYLFDVRTGDDYVQLDLYTVATYIVTGIRGPTRLQSSVRFQYDGGLTGVTVQQLQDDIGEWQDTEGEYRPAFKESPPAAAPRSAERATSTIRLGQTQRK